MAIKKSVRLTDPTIEALRPLSDVHGAGMNWSGSINAMAEQFALIVGELKPEFTSEQWNAIYCCFNGYAPHPDLMQEIATLPWHIDQGYQYDAQVTEFLGDQTAAAAFINQIKALSPAQRLAVIYQANKFWRNGPIADDLSENEDLDDGLVTAPY